MTRPMTTRQQQQHACARCLPTVKCALSGVGEGRRERQPLVKKRLERSAPLQSQFGRASDSVIFVYRCISRDDVICRRARMLFVGL